ncbi:hypothetical protein LR948_02365 [Roseivivax sp. GX 12232]|uniref:hypothetical protein n=1 Tax=Roseivivax sp. GX 12232 TaxID=2900547 RepID=UPI001E2C24B4|nr:hypothetical protein [Roseivivax sp. GX 12232]MCE0504188.1 hypothetical protein [Roseivivax sp. GX 12232]
MGSAEVSTTVMEFAAQTGRLDFLSAVLAVLAIILGVGAFPVFFFVQRRAEQVAREEVSAALEGVLDRIENEAISKVEAMLPTLYEEYSEIARRAADDDVANAIAAAQEDGGDAGNADK